MSDLDGSAVASLRRLNGSKVLSVLRAEAYRKFTVREMSIATGLSRPTVGRLLDDLVEVGWALDVEGTPGSTGRPARRYWFNRLRGVIVSADVGPGGAAIMITDLVGNELAWVLEIGHEFTSVEVVVEYLLPAIDAQLERVRLDLGLAVDELPVRAVSLAAPVMPGPDGTHIEVLSIVEGWRGASFLPALREHFGEVPILINNDVALAAEAEMHVGALATANQAVFCMLSSACLMVLVHDGVVHLGSHHPAGDIGDLPEYAWKDAILGALRDAGASPSNSVQAMVDAALAGEPAAVRASTQLGTELARGIRDVAALWDPDTIVFAGQFPTVGPSFLGPIEKALFELGGDDFDLRTTEVPEGRGGCIGGTIKALDAIDWTV